LFFVLFWWFTCGYCIKVVAFFYALLTHGCLWKLIVFNLHLISKRYNPKMKYLHLRSN
jgi:hypothetical protein